MSESSDVMATESLRGFHFTFAKTFNVSSCQGCNLHLSYKLPPQVFPDPYELQLDSLLSCTFLSQPNLELPDAVVGEEGTEFNCQVPISPNVAAKGKITVAIPLHVRYGLPLSATQSMRSVQVTAPLAACSCLSTEGIGSISISLPDKYTTEVTFPVGVFGDIYFVEVVVLAIVATTALYLLLVFERTWKKCNSVK